MPGPARLCDLGGMGVVVTRPVQQAEALCACIEANGGQAIRFPAIDIRADPSTATRRRLAAAAGYDWIVFVSPNAVRHALPHLPEDRSGLKTVAVGESTARGLADAGCTEVLTPSAGADSESLLALGAFARVDGQRVLIVRGHGGRALLGDELRGRGAIVDYAEVYRRMPASADPASLLARWEASVRAVTVTSGEILENLIRLMAGDARLFATPLVVVSPRIAELATRRGFGKVVTAAGPDERSIVTALCVLAESGAPRKRHDGS